jgi:hypothetical protein
MTTRCPVLSRPIFIPVVLQTACLVSEKPQVGLHYGGLCIISYWLTRPGNLGGSGKTRPSHSARSTQSINSPDYRFRSSIRQQKISFRSQRQSGAPRSSRNCQYSVPSP